MSYLVRQVVRNGRQRQIEEPDRVLKAEQRAILKELHKVPIHGAAHGQVPGRSTWSNAAPHCGAALVVTFDIADFYHSIRFDTVTSTIGHERALACCYSGRLPTGAPTSGAVANIVCAELDAQIVKLGWTYTRYVDDLTLSAALNYADISVLCLARAVRAILAKHGFQTRDPKTRVMRRHQRQLVTGLIVNGSTPRAPRELRRRLRAAQHNAKLGSTGTWDATQIQGVTGYVRE